MSILDFLQSLFGGPDNLALTQCQLELEDSVALDAVRQKDLATSRKEIAQLRTDLLTERNRLVVLTNQYGNLQAKLDNEMVLSADKDRTISSLKTEVNTMMNENTKLQNKIDVLDTLGL